MGICGGFCSAKPYPPVITDITPAQKHSGEDIVILEKRRIVYENAKKLHPERWSGKIRNWNPIVEVKLNPSNEGKEQKQKVA
ncbi:hypothetical protein KKD49_03150 [Myxococcota bacterium]|nr:hypothetical protein [Myxococcota bacterium]